MGRYADMLLTAEAPQEQGKWSSQLLDVEQPQQPQERQKPKRGPVSALLDSIRGRRDPKYADIGTVYDQHADVLENPMGMSATLGASDAQLADTVRSALGDRFVRQEKDANDYDVFVTRGKDGQEQRGYLNAPGLDTQDVVRGVRGSLPYALAGGGVGALTRGAGVGVQLLAQGAGAGTTSLAGDVAQMPLGSEQGVELGKAAVTTAFGAAAPVASAIGSSIWRRFVTIPGLVDSATGQLTTKGIEAARRAGVDPADITPDFSRDFAKSLANTGDEAAAATQAGIERMGIPATRGQATKDPYLLTQEEGMRRKLYGEQAQNTILGFDQRQQDAIARAALGDDPAHRTGVGYRINPNRKPGSVQEDRLPASLGEGAKDGLTTAREAARTAENDAWSKATALEATPDALKELPAKINAALSGSMPNERATPAAYQMAKELERILKGEAPEKAASFLDANPTKNVDQMRRNLLSIYQSADNNADKKMSGAMYDAFNDWIGDAASKAMLRGDPQAAMELVKARGFTKEVRELFSPQTASGRSSPGASRLQKMQDADSGEGVIQALFGSQGSRGASEGTVEALQSFRTALKRFAPADVAKQSWDDVRLAYWTRLVTAKNGELVGPTAMMNNIKSAMTGQNTVFKVLYSEAERREISQLVRALATVSYKPPNASGSGYTAASFAKEGVLKLLDSFGLGTPARAALSYTGVGKAINAAVARRAVDPISRPVRPNIAPVVTGAGSAYARD